MASNNYLAWCKEFNEGNYKIKDIDGREWDLKADNIEYVFTKSQWKLNKFYQNEYNEDGTIKVYGWDKYKKAFKENNCKANICNVEPSKKKDYRKAKFSYQMWQSLVDITDEEIDSAKKDMISIIKDIEDSPERIVNSYSLMNLLGLDSFDTRKKHFNEVTKEDIKRVAKKIKMDTIFLLYGDDKDEENND
jgi:hypothetical protein